MFRYPINYTQIVFKHIQTNGGFLKSYLSNKVRISDIICQSKRETKISSFLTIDVSS